MRYIVKDTPCGKIRGADTQQGYFLFQNIPYAKAGRWERPTETTHWEGVLDATIPTPWCIQPATYSYRENGTLRFYSYETVIKQTVSYSEDCQRLNIWTPENGEKAPVIVYIHGGSNINGGSTAINQHGDRYAQKGVVAVTINYRLSVFASAIGGGYTGNYGLWDQIAALSWIHNNIASFGGDPDRITVMGESAGATSTQNLIYTPFAKGLFHRAIMMSGGGIYLRNRTPDKVEKVWDEVRADLGNPSWAEMKEMDPETLLMAWIRVIKTGKHVRPAPPVIDGITIPDNPEILAKEGRVNDVPAIIGVLSEDAHPYTMYQAALEWGELMEEQNMGPVYGFYFDRQQPGSDDGAYHNCDVRYAFGKLDTCWRPFTEIDYRISENMMDYFIAFATTGEPAAAHLAKWEPLGKTQKKFLHFGDEPCAMVDVPEERLQTWQAKGKPFPTR